MARLGVPVGERVRSLAFLSILQRSSPLVPNVQAIEILLCRNGLSAACYEVAHSC